MNEFKLAYEGAALPVLPLRYVDFAAWQRQLENTFSSQEAFWRRQLAGPLPRIELPVLRERSTVTIYKAHSRELLIKGAAFDQVKKAAAHAGVSVFMYLLSVYYILIAKISGSREVIIGTDADGRTVPALRQVVGTFVNVLPLRMRVPQQAAFQSFLQTVKQGLLDALENQDYQFDKMQALLDDPQQRIVEVYCSNTGFFEKDAVLRDIAFVPVSPGELPQTTRYELELNISEHAGHIHLTFLYSTDLYDSGTISMLMAYYHNILFSVMEDPVMEIGNIKLEQHSFNA
jgi:non-ribosomal peptide synthetase component F